MFKLSIRRYLSLALVLALVLTASIGSLGQASAAGEVGLARAIAAQEANSDSIMSIDGVIGTAIGNGSGGGHIVLALTTAQGVKGLPGAVDGVIVRPLVTGEINALKGKPGGYDRTARIRPVPNGVSTGHTGITAGTVGARVYDGAGNYFALSNNHVYANQNDAVVGDAVLQPGPYDGGSAPDDTIGTLSAFEPIVFSTSANNLMDAAIALSSDTILQGKTPNDGYGFPSSTPQAPSLNLAVQKYGRTTGQTASSISATNAIVNVGYDGGTARFIDQIIISGSNFSAGGDSGSLIVTDDNNRNPVALLFAGSNSYTIGNPIGPVLSTFGITIDDGSGAPTPTGPTGTIDGSITDSVFGGDIDGATVVADTGQSTQTAADGSYSLIVPITATGITVTAAGYEDGSASGLIVTVGGTTTENVALVPLPPVEIETSTVDSISYATSGGGQGTKDLLVTLHATNTDPAVGGNVDAVIGIELWKNGSRIATGSASTGADGSVTFILRNHKAGNYTTVVTSVVADGYEWDGEYQANSYTK